MSLQDAIGDRSKLQRLRIAVRQDMVAMIHSAQDKWDPSLMELAAAVLMPLSGLAFSPEYVTARAAQMITRRACFGARMCCLALSPTLKSLLWRWDVFNCPAPQISNMIRRSAPWCMMLSHVACAAPNWRLAAPCKTSCPSLPHWCPSTLAHLRGRQLQAPPGVFLWSLIGHITLLGT